MTADYSPSLSEAAPEGLLPAEASPVYEPLQGADGKWWIKTTHPTPEGVPFNAVPAPEGPYTALYEVTTAIAQAEASRDGHERGARAMNSRIEALETLKAAMQGGGG